MIINNYTQLPENKETYYSFLTRRTPICFVRDFPFRIKPGEHLLIPYYVDTPDEDSKTKLNYNATFTTIVELDGDTLDAQDVPVIKKTTFAGEHIIDIGSFELEEGELNKVHTFSIRTIQNNGVSSITDYFKVLVEDEDSYESYDFSNTNSFTSEFSSNDQYKCATRYVESYKNAADETSTGPYEKRIIAQYDVTINRNPVTNLVSDITITVNGNIVQTGYKLNYRTSQFEVEQVNVKQNGVVVSTINNIKNIDISGTYVLSNMFTDSNGNTCNLMDYLDIQPTNLDTNAIEKAIENKVALIRLFEAMKAYKSNGVNIHTAILPKFDFVIDYGPSVTVGDEVRPTIELDVPSEFTLDMNGSTIRCLQRKDITHGHLLTLKGKFNTRIKNGRFIGNYEHFRSYKAGKPASYENLAVIRMLYSTFCSFENLDVSYSVGYDCNYDRGAVTGHILAKRDYPPFSVPGFIDYDGNEVTTYTYDNGDDPAKFGCTCYRQNHTLSHPANGQTSYCLSDSSFCNNGTIFFITSHNPSSNDQYGAFQVNKPIFAHFYGDNNGTPVFLKTVKLGCIHQCIMPKGAVWYKLSCVGNIYSNDSNSNANDCLNGYNSADNLITCRIKKGQMAHSWGIEFLNCVYHDTRSCVWDVVGTQCLLKGCKFYNVAAERKNGGANANKVVVDIEDNSVYNFNLYVVDCEFLYGDNSSFTLQYCYNFLMRNCKGFSMNLYHNNYGVTFKDTRLSYYNRGFNMAIVPYPHVSFDNTVISGTFAMETSVDEAFRYPIPVQYSTFTRMRNRTNHDVGINAFNIIPFKSKIYNTIY